MGHMGGNFILCYEQGQGHLSSSLLCLFIYFTLFTYLRATSCQEEEKMKEKEKGLRELGFKGRDMRNTYAF